MISREKIEHIASLARLTLEEGEKAVFEKELSAIFAFVEKLNEVDTASVAPLAGGTTAVNVTRSDNSEGAKDQDIADELIAAAPTKEGRYIKVKKVFNRE